MSFVNIYELSEATAQEPIPGIAELGIAVGVYNGGLLAVFDRELSELALSNWHWLLGSDVTALAATAFGDIFFWSPKHGAVFFLETQLGQSTFVDREVRYLFEDFLTNPGVREGVLNSALFDSVSSRLGRLSYGKCYVAEPWVMLGGSGGVDTYGIGDLDVYLSLTGQSVRQGADEARRG